MKCPDCASEIVVKPEVVIQREPCKCGLTEAARNFRMGALVVLALILCGFGACLGDQYWTTKQVELLKESYRIRDKKNADIPPGEKAGLPFDVVPKGK